MYKYICIGICAVYTYLAFTGRSYFSPSPTRSWAQKGERAIFHK